MVKDGSVLKEEVEILEGRAICVDKFIDKIDAHMENAGLGGDLKKYLSGLEFRNFGFFLFLVILMVVSLSIDARLILLVFFPFFALAATRKSNISKKIINFIRFGKLIKILEYHKKKPFVHDFSGYFFEMAKSQGGWTLY